VLINILPSEQNHDEIRKRGRVCSLASRLRMCSSIAAARTSSCYPAATFSSVFATANSSRSPYYYSRLRIIVLWCPRDLSRQLSGARQLHFLSTKLHIVRLGTYVDHTYLNNSLPFLLLCTLYILVLLQKAFRCLLAHRKLA